MEAEVKQDIREPIKVLASFAPSKITVHFFCWRERIYRVQSMNLFHIERDGERRIYHIAVSAGGDAYQLAFDPRNLKWELRDIVTV